MKRIFSITLLLIFVASLPTWPHSDHSNNWEQRDRDRRQDLEIAENRWRADEHREDHREGDLDGATKAAIALLGSAFAISVSVASIIDPILFGEKCPQCKEYLSDGLFDSSADIYEHRRQCPTGHYYWGCNRLERINHKYCPDHPTDCLRCGGGGCHACWDPDRNVPKCLACGAPGSHQCPFD